MALELCRKAKEEEGFPPTVLEAKDLTPVGPQPPRHSMWVTHSCTGRLADNTAMLLYHFVCSRDTVGDGAVVGPAVAAMSQPRWAWRGLGADCPRAEAEVHENHRRVVFARRQGSMGPSRRKAEVPLQRSPGQAGGKS